ncbi:MAG: hypothetical protein PHD07_08705 [Bacteroidales bacterium]|nr:hypothetical protein [Bacteroidales bacterium]MDD3202115.1 hypothetical protein [Bacteroidales bacterium]
MPEVGKAQLKKRWGRDWGIFLLSLLLAFFIWVVHNLTLDYSVYMQYRLTVTTAIEGHAPVATSNEALLLRGKARGFYIIQHRDRKGSSTDISLNLDPKLFHKVAGSEDLYQVNSSDIVEKLSEALGSQFTIDFIESQVITFNFPSQAHKMVPVNPQTSISYQEQYMPVKPITLAPDSVMIYGLTEDLNVINSLNTKVISRSSVSKSVQGIVKIEPVRGIRMDKDELYYSLEVARYVEKTETLHIEVTNLPAGKSVIMIPSQIAVTYRIPFKESVTKRNNSDNMVFAVDYEDIVKSRTSKVIPKLYKSDRTLYSYELNPPLVECLLTDVK